MRRILPIFAIILGIAIVLILQSSVSPTKAQSPTEGTPYVWNLPIGFPPPPVPANNPMTVEKVELGRYLFYDQRLSGNGTQSCSSCHKQELAFTDGAVVSTGSTGELTPRNSMSLTNVAYNSTYTWGHPSLLNLEAQFLIPMFGEGPIELGITGNEEEVLNRFREDPLYQELFVAAFPSAEDPVNFDNIVASISSFVRTIISGNAPYDRFVYQGDITAMSESQIRGMNFFLSERFECFHCHTTFNFSLATVTAYTTFAENAFFNTGLYNLDGAGAYPDGNRGIFEITGNSDHMGLFRAPTLRNIELTGPYMHDGSIQTLEEVIEFYSNGGRLIEEGDKAGDGRLNPFKNNFVSGFDATDEEKQDILNFLLSLTDESFLTNPAYSDPFAE